MIKFFLLLLIYICIIDCTARRTQLPSQSVSFEEGKFSYLERGILYILLDYGNNKEEALVKMPISRSFLKLEKAIFDLDDDQALNLLKAIFDQSLKDHSYCVMFYSFKNDQKRPHSCEEYRIPSDGRCYKDFRNGIGCKKFTELGIKPPIGGIDHPYDFEGTGKTTYYYF